MKAAVAVNNSISGLNMTAIAPSVGPSGPVSGPMAADAAVYRE